MCVLEKPDNHENKSDSCGTHRIAVTHLIADKSFPRAARLLDAEGYSRVFKRNKRLTNRFWIVLAHRQGTAECRLGLAIAKKRAKRAVDRNKIKRIARESFREQRVVLSGIDAVVMNKDAAAKASTIELRQSIDMLWAELSVENRATENSSSNSSTTNG